MAVYDRYLYKMATRESDDEVNAAVNGVVTPQKFIVRADAGMRASIQRMIIFLGDAGALDADEYGNVGTLANGVEVGVYRSSDDSQVLDLTSGVTIKSNSDWGRICFDARPDSYGTGLNFISGRWTFVKDGHPLLLDPDFYFAVTINDDLSDMTHHYFSLRGTQSPLNN